MTTTAQPPVVDFQTPIGKKILLGEPLFTIHAETQGELAYSLAYAMTHDGIVQIGDAQ